MAEAEQAEVEEEAASGGGNKKLIIIFAVVLLVAIGGSIAATMFLLGGDESAEEEAADAEPVPTKAIYHELRPAFVVNYVLGAKPRYLQTGLSVMSRSPSAIDALISHGPLVRARILAHLTDQSPADLQTEEGKKALLESTAELLNTLLSEQGAEGEIEAVLFSSFVMQ